MLAGTFRNTGDLAEVFQRHIGYISNSNISVKEINKRYYNFYEMPSRFNSTEKMVKGNLHFSFTPLHHGEQTREVVFLIMMNLAHMYVKEADFAKTYETVLLRVNDMNSKEFESDGTYDWAMVRYAATCYKNDETTWSIGITAKTTFLLIEIFNWELINRAIKVSLDSGDYFRKNYCVDVLKDSKC
jgi:hypothetical protein